MIADSTRQSASRRCSGSASTSPSWPDGSTARSPRARAAVIAVASGCGASCASVVLGIAVVGTGRLQNLIAPSGSFHPGKIRAPRLSCCPPPPSRPRRAPPRRRSGVPSPTRQPAATMQSRSAQPRADLGAARARPTRSTCAPRRRARSRRAPTRLPTCAPGATCTPRSSTRRRDHAAVRSARRRRSPASRSPSRSRDGRVDVALEDVEGALQVALGRADVEPVAARRGTRRGRRRSAAARPRARSRLALRAAPARGSRARARRRRR